MAPQRGSAGCRGVIGPFPQPLWMKAREGECSTYRVRRGGANAIIAMRYDATEVMGGVTEVLAYGTAVAVEPA